MKIIRVGLDVPVAKLFDYRADDVDDDDVRRRVLVPFGRKTAVGIIVEIAATSEVPDHRLKPALRVLRDTPALHSDDLRLLRFASDYYHHALGPVLMNALPARLRRGHALQRPVETRFVLTASGEAADFAQLPARAVVKRRLLNLFKQQRALDAVAVKTVAPTAPAALKQLIACGWVERHNDAPFAPPTVPHSAAAGPALTPEQAEAVRAVCVSRDAFQPFLLLGVTGSGKTEVYLRVVDAVLHAGRQAL